MNKRQIASLITFILGIIMLIIGVVFLVLRFVGGSSIADGEYLVSANQWVLTDDANCAEANCTPSVIWQFTEIGKGTLTTNNHENDYDFIWAIEDGKLKIETKWLYDLEDEYEYHLDQGSGTLNLKTDEQEYEFTADFR